MCCGAVDMGLGAPVVLRDADGRARIIISVYPTPEPGDQHDFIVDPRWIDIIGIPQRARGLVARKLHGG